MLTKLPYCPNCQEDELWLSTPGREEMQTAPRLIIACKECGWRASVDAPLTVDGFSEAVTAAMRAARGEK